jgi:hypothetical protein
MAVDQLPITRIRFAASMIEDLQQNYRIPEAIVFVLQML